MDITYQLFCQVCPSAQTPSKALYDTLKPHVMREWVKVLETYTAPSMRTVYNAVPFDINKPGSTNYEMVLAALTLACAIAYERMIPHLDLVLTPTGFGVVSNENTAPASADRVNNLRRELKRTALEAFCTLIHENMLYQPWVSTMGTSVIYCLMWEPGPFMNDDKFDKSLEGLQKLQAQTLQYEEELRHFMDSTQYDELISKARTNEVVKNTIWARCHSLCLNYIYQRYHMADTRPILHALRHHLETNPYVFSKYKASKIYNALHAEPYENQKEDPTFFFG